MSTWKGPAPEGGVQRLLGEVTRSADRVLSALDALDDEAVRGPSALPGWHRGQVIVHLVGAADAYLRLLAGARAGAAVQAGAGQDDVERPAAELAAVLRERLARLAADAAGMPEDRWEVLVTALAGWRHPAWFTLYRCWRELETHHVDLAVGYRPGDWPTAYVSWALDDTLAALAAREFPLTRVTALDLGRDWTLAATGPTVSGAGHELLGWLAGRTDGSALASDLPLPEPPRWPLPPVPGWG
ncbi:maleylpyruvate isomerase family mycothiol-dependent enzyme [Kitasatospora sp. NBC_01287]|uniref:maleylpyruvate isomerase family mycothiol-dependent enzyme n=1 Tax=Kitasatospora sp. NBC_01287 TaxID=2903573 RepID=UPI00225A6E56|nr:maleylpyruvate isomerase family mycothiol-dependent enzyme [Kitasatospora sp. NBC_01287]MCX4744505.1 maleylpyruvate isomerase family mycothiol-dependent enzyme [Kitasatospora sp. NBC_01287]